MCLSAYEMNEIERNIKEIKIIKRMQRKALRLKEWKKKLSNGRSEWLVSVETTSKGRKEMVNTGRIADQRRKEKRISYRKIKVERKE